MEIQTTLQIVCRSYMMKSNLCTKDVMPESLWAHNMRYTMADLTDRKL